ncbi:MAG TPA: hypothetical protein VM901_07450 [Bdellovibrionota bacterium]|nr:hypothetical protein [Bdellovibrionota bacterium]
MKKRLTLFLLACSIQTFAAPKELPQSKCKQIIRKVLWGALGATGGAAVLTAGVIYVSNAERDRNVKENLDYWALVDQSMNGSLKERMQVTPDSGQGFYPHCVACSFANSLSYLNQHYKVGKTLDPAIFVNENGTALRKYSVAELQKIAQEKLSGDFYVQRISLRESHNRTALNSLQHSIASGSAGILNIHEKPQGSGESGNEIAGHALTLLSVQGLAEGKIRVLAYDSQDITSQKKPLTLDAEYNASSQSFQITSDVHKGWEMRNVFLVEHVDIAAPRLVLEMTKKWSAMVESKYQARKTVLSGLTNLKDDQARNDFNYHNAENILKNSTLARAENVATLEAIYRISKKFPTDDLLRYMKKDLSAPAAFEMVSLLKTLATGGDSQAKAALKDIERYTSDPLAIHYARMP